MARHALASKPRCTRGWRRRLMYCGLALLGVLLAAGFFLTRPERLAWITAGVLERITGTTVHIDYAHLSLDGRLELEGVRFAVPDLPTPLARLGEIETVRITPDLRALGRGRLQLRSIVLMQPTLYLTRDADDRYNFQHLPATSPRTGRRRIADALPEMFVRQGMVRFAQWDGHADTSQPLATMGLQGRLTRDAHEPTLYRFTLRQADDELLPGVTFHGSLDLARQYITTELQGFQFTDAQQRLLPARLRTLWQRMDPAGEMPDLTLRYDRTAGGGLTAELRVRHVAMNVPVPGIDSRMHDVAGLFRLQNNRLTIDTLTGEIEGIRYHINGHVGAFELDAPMHLRLVTDTFEITDSPPPYLAGLPDVVQRHYAKYKPTGRFQTEIELRREQAGKPMTYEGLVNVLGANAEYDKFAVPLHDLRGQVRFTPEQLRIIDIRGRGPSGGTALVEGEVTPLGPDPATDIRVTVRDAPVDHHVMTALKPAERRVVSMFMHEPSRAALIDAGVIRNAPPLPWQWRERVLATLRDTAKVDDAGDANNAPVFTLGGRVHAYVHVTRDAGPGRKPKATVTLAPAGPVRLLFEHWPYPMRMTAGRVVIAPDIVHVENVQLHGLTGGEASVVGRVHRHVERRGDIHPDLHIRDAALPIDDLLLASIPSPQDRWIRQLGLTGRLTAAGNIIDNDAGEPDFTLDFKLDDGVAQPFGGAYALTDIAAEVELRRQAATLKHFSARRDTATFAGDGTIDWADKNGPLIDLTLTGTSLTIEHALLDLLPPDHANRAALAKVMKRHQPAGRFDAELTVGERASDTVADDETAAPPYRLALRPQTLRLTHNDQPIRFHELTGEIVVTREQATLDELTAHFDTGWLSANGPVKLDETGEMTLQLAGELEQLDGPWVGLLPSRVRETLEALNLQGKVALKSSRLHARPHADNSPQLELAGVLTFNNARLDAGVAVEDIDGKLTFDIARLAGETTPRMVLQLDAERLRVHDRIIAPLTLSLRNDDNLPTLKLDTLRGEVYNGVLVGSGMVDLQPGIYHVDLALQDVHVEPFLAAGRSRRNDDANAHRHDADETDITDNSAANTNAGENTTADADTKPASLTPVEPHADASPGRLNASFTLQGELSDPATRRGRGSLEIHNARLYERPVALAMLQAINFSLPVSDAFDRGSINFLLEGETLYIDNLALKAPSLAVQGTGTLHYPTRKLDLHLRASNPSGLNLGVVSDMVDLVRDQLVGIRVTGTLDKPRARVVGLEDLRRPWSDAFTP